MISGGGGASLGAVTGRGPAATRSRRPCAGPLDPAPAQTTKPHPGSTSTPARTGLDREKNPMTTTRSVGAALAADLAGDRARLFAMGLRRLAKFALQHQLPILYAWPDLEDGTLVVGVHADDLPAYVAALDLPAPDWEARLVGGDVVEYAARWPAGTFAGYGFRVICYAAPDALGAAG